MPLIPCSGCRTRDYDKLSQVTWAWSRADRTRAAWRQRLCVNCFAARVLAIEEPIPADGPLTCPGCHIETEHDFDAVYATAYVPGAGKFRYEFPFCGACAVEVRNRAQQNAELLPERELESRGQAPGLSNTPTAWDQLGIRPRE
jgi:hypothetical protein